MYDKLQIIYNYARLYYTNIYFGLGTVSADVHVWTWSLLKEYLTRHHSAKLPDESASWYAFLCTDESRMVLTKPGTPRVIQRKRNTVDRRRSLGSTLACILRRSLQMSVQVDMRLLYSRIGAELIHRKRNTGGRRRSLGMCSICEASRAWCCYDF